MKKFWESYGWVIALAACALFTLRMLLGRDTFCGPDTEQCLREWISASGGWIALAIGVPSLIALRQQIRAAVRANENSAKILLRRNYALAQKVKSRSYFLGMTAVGLRASIENQQPGYIASPPSRRQLAHKLDTIVDIVQEGGFDKFEEEIEFPTPYNAEYFRRRANHIKASLTPMLDIALTDEIRMDVIHFCESGEAYAECCRDIAQKFIVEADEMRGVSHADAALDGTP